ncbi:MAG TPA: hypothetical protein VHX37_06165 [Acidobacteriaceae bacterium]|nr:hypothetical protein [Acidobacteriaceae bacterium]
MDLSRRSVIKAGALALLEQWCRRPGQALAFDHAARWNGPRVVVLMVGGVRRSETFSPEGLVHIPHLSNELLSQAAFFPWVRNAGVTSHYNTIASVLTGTWQRVDDWGRMPPENPTIFEYARKETGLDAPGAWFISSNKALSDRIGASSVRGFGPSWGANVVFPKQLLIDSVLNAVAHGRTAHTGTGAGMGPEIDAMLAADNYEGLGWSVGGNRSFLDSSTRESVARAVDNLVSSHTPVTGDEFTFLVAREILRTFAPPLLVMTFSDVEVAHFGSWSLHLAGIRTLDRLVSELWNEIESNTVYRGSTTLFVLPEFGRDLDGSVTNGFFNHRLDNDSTRTTWMLCLGPGVAPGVVERPVQHIDICPTVAGLLGLKVPKLPGSAIAEIRT